MMGMGEGETGEERKRGNGAYHLCVCLHKYEFVFVCSWLCVPCKWEYTGSDADILDISIKNRRQGKKMKEVENIIMDTGQKKSYICITVLIQ